MPLLCCILLMIGSCFYPVKMYSQQSLIAHDVQQLYFEGIHHFKQKKFISARILFDQFIQQSSPLFIRKNRTLISNAKFYRAICALELRQPDAEKLLTEYIASEDETLLKRTAYFHLGRLLYENKKYKDAIEYYKKVDLKDLSRSERDEYRFELGYCYFFIKNLDESFKYFREIKDVNNKYYFPSNYYYGYISFTRQQYDDALRSFERIKESRMYEKVVPYYIAQIYFQRKQYDKVISYLQPMIDDAGLRHQEELNLLLGRAYYEIGNYAKAIHHIEAYLNKQNPRKEELYQLGNAYYQLKRYKEAISYLQQLDNLSDTLGQSALYLLGDCFLQINDKQKALSAFQRAAWLNINPLITEHATLNYAKLSFELGLGKQAILALQSFMSDFPQSTYINEAKSFMTDLLLSTKNYREALNVIESLQLNTIQLKRAYQQITFHRALEVFNDKNYQEAIRLFHLSQKNPVLNDYKALSYYWLAECHYQLSDYDAAINEYIKFIQLTSSADIKDKQNYLVLASYAVGYCYYKKQDFQMALRYFTESSKYVAPTFKADYISRLQTDVQLRQADCYFALKRYNEAIEKYDAVAATKHDASDYALFQKATILGINGKQEEKITTLEKLLLLYPASIYKDNAQFHIGEAYFAAGKNQAAINAYHTVIQKYPQSILITKSWLRLGLIYYQLDNLKKSVECYKYVIDNYPSSNEAREALLALKDMSIAEGNPDLFMEVISSRKDLQISASEKDSIAYMAAETRYTKGQCEEAISAFNDYLKNFTDGHFNLQAHFYRSECLFRLKKYSECLSGYEHVVKAGQNVFREKSALRAAEIYYHHLRQYSAAELYYQSLLEYATTSDNVFIAQLGMMRCAYHLEKYPQIHTYAEKILNNSLATSEQQTEARFYLAKYYLHQQQKIEALSHFRKVATKSTNIMGAESQYHIAHILFELGQLKEAEDECFRLIDNYSAYDYWYINAFILLADIYVAGGNLFQAKATLQSIIEHSDDQQLMQVAHEKMNKIIQQEKKRSQLLQDADAIDTPLDTIKVDELKK